MNGTDENDFGYCDLHEEPVSEKTYRWKGCWGCWHFAQRLAFPYMDVHEAAIELQVSESTVRRWLKTGKLKGEIFVQERPSYCGLPSPRKYHIRAEDINELYRQRQQVNSKPE